MKFTTVSLIISLLVCCPLFELQAQYLGGDGDGYAVVGAANLLLDGGNLAAVYQGGVGDGYALVGAANLLLDGGNLAAIYQGGVGDGYTLVGAANLLLDGGNLAAIYLGGVGDGYALVGAANLPLNSGAPSPLVFRVERATGDVFALGSFIPGGADIAERIHVSEPVEPGDVIELDPSKPGHYRKARGHSNLIAGVITTKPGFTLGNSPAEMEAATVITAEKDLRSEAAGRPLLALMGRVPVKATTENGAINPGDLLTVSSKPGYAMRCTEAKGCEGAIIGKALEGLERGEGLILVLVMSH